MVTKEQVGKSYTKAVAANQQASAIAKKASTYPDAQKYAKLIGSIASKTLGSADISWDLAEEVAEVVVEVLRKAHSDVTGVTAAVQRKINQDAGIGLSPLSPRFDTGRAVGLAAELVSEEPVADGVIANLIINNVLHTVDESVRVNMEAQENVGLGTRITREYDDVGLHNGTEPCLWCMARAGTWTKYMEALNAGVFERHPGCGCIIDYKVGKTHTISTGRSGRGWNFQNA